MKTSQQNVKVTNEPSESIVKATHINQTDQIIQTSAKKHITNKVRVRLNMITTVPNFGSMPCFESEPNVTNAGEIVEIPKELAEKWTTETYQLSPTKMCERKGGDFLPTEYITRASYV